jgi:superfamily II DNA/RNA helicase
MQSFSSLGVPARIVGALAKRDIHTPFPIQERVLRDALAGRDVLAKAPTGSGKTLSFAIPVVERIDARDERPAAVVLVPTRELATQVAGEIAAIAPSGITVATVYGGVPLHPQAKRARTAHVIVATPGRLNDLLERRAIALEHVKILVLDEADRMLDMGFKPQVDRLVRRIPRDRQTMFFSATLDGAVGELAALYTRNPIRVQGTMPVHEEEPGEVEHRFVSVTADTKVDALIEELEGDRGLALVFVRTKRGADRLVQKLARRDISAEALHGDMTQGARERSLARFHAGKVRTLVATDVAARGLDLVDITHVINFDPPEDDKGYVHRVGRTGRAGRGGNGITLVTPEQQADVSRVAMRLGHREQFEREGMSSARAKLVYSGRRGRRSRW